MNHRLPPPAPITQVELAMILALLALIVYWMCTS